MVDSVRDHLVPQISEKTTVRKMFKTLKKIFEHHNINVTLTLMNKLSKMKMTKSENIVSYFMRITELWDKLKSSGNNLKEKDLVMTLKWSPTILGVFHPNHKGLNQVAQI